MPIRVTQTITRPLNSIPWHDPSLQEDWYRAYYNASFDISEFIIEPETVILSDDGKTMIRNSLYKNIESFLKSQKDVIPLDLRKAQRQYRDSANIKGSITCVDTETNIELTKEQIIAKEREMRAAGLLSNDHEYFEVRNY